MSGLQRGHGLSPRDRRKRIEKLVEAVVPFEVVNQVPERHASADEDRRPVEDIWIAVHDKSGSRHKPFDDSTADRDEDLTTVSAASGSLRLPVEDNGQRRGGSVLERSVEKKSLVIGG